jgi:hypothetical protein
MYLLAASRVLGFEKARTKGKVGEVVHEIDDSSGDMTPEENMISL